MNIKIVYNGEMGFLQTLKNVYEYLIPAKNISFEKFIKYNNNENSLKTNAELVYDKMQGMDFFSLYTEEFHEQFY
jgi:tyrosyl-tRNA synthetase